MRDVAKIRSRARGEISETLLTETERSGFFTLDVLNDRPLVDHLEDGERLQYLHKTASNRPRRHRDDETEHVGEKASSYLTVVAVTDRRLFAVVGGDDGDEIVSVPYADTSTVEVNSGILKERITLETDDETVDFYTNSWSELDEVEEYVESRVETAGSASFSGSVTVSRQGNGTNRDYSNVRSNPLSSVSASGSANGSTAEDGGSGGSTDGTKSGAIGAADTDRGREAKKKYPPGVQKSYRESAGSGSGSSAGRSGDETPDRSSSATRSSSARGSRTEPSTAGADSSAAARSRDEPEYTEREAHVRCQELIEEGMALYDQGTAAILQGQPETAEARIEEALEQFEAAATLTERYDIDGGDTLEAGIADVRNALSELEADSSSGGVRPSTVTELLQTVEDYAFEELVADVWTERGWSTAVTSGARDKGVDVVAEKSAPFEQKQLIQAKRYAEGNKVGSTQIQQYASLRHQFDNVDAVVVVTTSAFTDQAEEAARDLNVKTVDGDTLTRMIIDEGLFEVVAPYLTD